MSIIIPVSVVVELEPLNKFPALSLTVALFKLSPVTFSGFAFWLSCIVYVNKTVFELVETGEESDLTFVPLFKESVNAETSEITTSSLNVAVI